MNLREVLTPAALAPLFAAYDDKNDGYENYRKQVKGIVWPAVQRHLEGLRAAGKLAPIPNSKGRSSNFMDAWNAMVTGEGRRYSEPQYMWHAILQTVSHGLVFDALDAIRESAKLMGSRTEAEKIACERLIAAIEKGDAPKYMSGEHECTVTGDRLSLVIKDWRPSFSHYRDGKLVPIEEVPEPRIVELEVELKSGNLLIADWFRIDAFTNAVKLEKERSINSVQGCQEFTERSLAEHGFVTVFVGNSSPRIISKNDALVLGYYDEDGDEDLAGKELGSVCTDLWWATIIEREHLVSIVARTHGEEEAERLVAAYLVEHAHVVNEVKVSPGKHMLYFAGDPEIIEERFAAKDFPMGPIEPYFVLSNRKLDLVAKARHVQPEPDKPASLAL